MSYTILDNGRAIRCELCGMVSFSLDDVRELYCGNCRRFHREIFLLWTVYDHPPDYPDHFVARLFADGVETNVGFLADTLEALRDKLPPGLYPLARSPSDPPSIVETWL